MTAADTAGRFEWPARALFGVLLAGCTIAALAAGGLIFAALVWLIAIGAAREWHRMLGGARYAMPIIASGVAVAAALASVILLRGSLWPVWILAIGSVAAALAASAAGNSPFWNGLGTLYVGVPAVSLVALRTQTVAGVSAALVVFLAVWAADTGALLIGKVVGGPKLVPTLSPNKTWAGFLAGTVFSVAVTAVYLGYYGGRLWQASLLGLALALAAHGGDLFESWVKRRAGRKNSGGLIPGHGGVLDRVDSTLFAAPLAALLVFVFGLDPLCGGHA